MTAVKTTGTYTPNFFVPGAPVTITNVTDKALTYFQTNGTDPEGYFLVDPAFSWVIAAGAASARAQQRGTPPAPLPSHRPAARG